MSAGGVVGVIANPASARDIRRLVASGAAVTTNHKLNMLSRLLAGLSAAGVDRVISMSDMGGISAGLAATSSKPSGAGWPKLEFIDHPITQTASDTAVAVEEMVAREVDAIVVLGGDGTNRVVAGFCGPVPVASISTGTNNAFPGVIEPTVVGLATGLVATGRVDPAAATRRCKALLVQVGSATERALVDVAILSGNEVGSGAIWESAAIGELFLTFAEPQAIGLSSIGGHLRPVCRDEPTGLHIRLGPPAVHRVRVPLAPGLLSDIDIAQLAELGLDQAIQVNAPSGVIALDGERVLRFAHGETVTVMLSWDGPLAIDVARTMQIAATSGVLDELAQQA